MANSNLKVVFSFGNIVQLDNNQCSCPNMVEVNVSNLTIGKNYTVYINNLNNVPVRTFPESYSFTATNETKNLSFYYQFA